MVGPRAVPYCPYGQSAPVCVGYVLYILLCALIVPIYMPMYVTIDTLLKVSRPTSSNNIYIYIFFYLSIFIQDNSTQHSQRLELKLRPDAFLHDRLQA